MVEEFQQEFILKQENLLLKQSLLFFMLVVNLVVEDIKYQVDFMVLELQL
jgi:hypothetical protein